MSNEDNIKYYELYTEFGSLYLYEIKNDNSVELREFFTGKIAHVDYDKIHFDNGLVSFTTRTRYMDGYIKDDYLREMEPFKFLESINDSISSDEEFEKTKKVVFDIFKLKENNSGNNSIIIPKKEPTILEKNKSANKILKMYINKKK